MEHLYFLFRFADFYFLAPLSCVRTIEDSSVVNEQLPIVKYVAGESAVVQTDYKYRIVFENKDIQFGMETDSVLGIREIQQDAFLKLEEPVITRTNKCLWAAVVMSMDDGQEILAFALDLECLSEKEGIWSL